MDAEILGVKKAYQGKYGTAPSLLLQHISHLGHPFGWRTQSQMQESMQIRVSFSVKD